MISPAYVLRRNRVIKKAIENPLYKSAIVSNVFLSTPDDDVFDDASTVFPDDDVFDDASTVFPEQESSIPNIFCMNFSS